MASGCDGSSLFWDHVHALDTRFCWNCGMHMDGPRCPKCGGSRVESRPLPQDCRQLAPTRAWIIERRNLAAKKEFRNG